MVWVVSWAGSWRGSDKLTGHTARLLKQPAFRKLPMAEQLGTVCLMVYLRSAERLSRRLHAFLLAHSKSTAPSLPFACLGATGLHALRRFGKFVAAAAARKGSAFTLCDTCVRFFRRGKPRQKFLPERKVVLRSATTGKRLAPG